MSFIHRFWLKRMDALADRSPALYYAFVRLLIVAGYSYLLLFPVIVVFSLAFLVYITIRQPVMEWTLIDWSIAAVLVLIAAGATIVTRALIKTRPDAPPGRPLTSKAFPILIDRINELSVTYGAPEIHYVKLTTRFDIELVSSRGSGFPPRSVYTLLIGLPVMSCMSPLHLKLLLARIIGQLAKSRTSFNRRIVHIRSLWNSCSYNFGHEWKPSTALLRIFFTYYAAFFRTSTVPAARMEVFVKDACMLDVVPSEKAAEAIIAASVKRRFLEKDFWPTLNNTAYTQPKPSYLPYSSMNSIMSEKLDDDLAEMYYQEEIKHEPEAGAEMPALKQRLAALGIEEMEIPPMITDTAATHFLGESLSAIQKQLDNVWYLQNKNIWARRYRKGLEEKKRLKILREQASKALLSNQEAIEYLLLVEKYVEPPKSIPLYSEILRTNSLDPEVCYQVGRLLLDAGDNSGIDAMHLAMDLSRDMTVRCCNRLANFMAMSGNLKKAQEYRRMILSYQSEN